LPGIQQSKKETKINEKQDRKKQKIKLEIGDEIKGKRQHKQTDWIKQIK
jgi:hypothetical protein